MRLIIHNGRHKSGTTSLQYACAANADKLRELGILYPSSMQENSAHHPLARALLADSVDQQERKKIWDSLFVENSELGCGDILVSSEVFQSIKNPKRFVRHIPTNDVLFVTYVRNLIDYFTSTYQQHVYATTLTKLPEDRVSEFKFRLFPFMNRLKTDLDDKIVFRQFDRDKLIDKDIVADFFHVTGYSEVPFKGASNNPSISGNLLLFKISLNHFLRGRTPVNILKVLDGLALEEKRFSGRLKLSSDLFQNLGKVFHEDTIDVRKKFFSQFHLPQIPTGNSFDFDQLDHDIERISERFSEACIPLPRQNTLKSALHSVIKTSS